ncbi:MAG TPA: hypothetical protein VJM10_03685 [Candidatus Methylomirabilis sp.]|nr:hypothetical protein [Candidatus Methylomirabilis sp.]
MAAVTLRRVVALTGMVVVVVAGLCLLDDDSSRSDLCTPILLATSGLLVATFPIPAGGSQLASAPVYQLDPPAPPAPPPKA